MTVVMENKHALVSDFETFEKHPSRKDPSWLGPVRQAAMSRFDEVGFPSTRDEEWRSTNVAPIVQATRFRLGEDGADGLSRQSLEPYRLAGGTGPCLVFVNGSYRPELSVGAEMARGVRLLSLAAAMAQEGQSLEPHLARYADCHASAFTALNTAFLQDGAVVIVSAGVVCEQPIHFLFVTSGGQEATITHPRNLIVTEPNSQVTVIESYVGSGPGREYFTNAVTEIVADENAVVDHYRLQQEHVGAFHVGAVRIHQKRSSTVTSHSIALGGALVRNEVHAVLDGEGSECSLNGLYLAGGTQHIDNHLRVEHAQPNCQSRENYRGILDDQARGVFCGRIVVHKDAQKTDAKQSNKNLLLSADAQIDTKPQLEIFADDVKCTHGATIGQLNEEALFYLRARGIGEAAARNLLIYAFATQSLDEIKCEPVRQQLSAIVSARLSAGSAGEQTA